MWVHIFSNLSCFPCLQEVLARFQTHVGSPSKATHPRVAIYLGHDTVIAPVLAALGAYKGADCVWPPYASRIVFELWEGSVSSEQHYVRIIFNGRPVTSHVPGCPVGEGSTCPLSTLAAHLASALGRSFSFVEACDAGSS